MTQLVSENFLQLSENLKICMQNEIISLTSDTWSNKNRTKSFQRLIIYYPFFSNFYLVLRLIG